MSDVIKLLPDSVANQIAAGEVIQRPASVVKELVENAVDAEASSIQIILKDAGRTLIQVIDDGRGMSATDARLAFERHSTSKIRHADDLFELHTMGFRGEALASIAAIAHVELRTCLKGETLGTRLLISASHCENQEPCVCPVGANFMIKDLFYNVPARRKFLKSNQVELSNILKEFERLALVNYNIAFTFVHNDNTMYKLSGGSFKQRILALFGTNMNAQLLPLAVDTDVVALDGFVGRPENARKRGALQYLFVNGRYMRHPYFHRAILSCYNELIPDDSQPCYFLNFNVAPQEIDVNIHPTKTEIKFENEQPIWQIIAAAVKETLGRFSLAPTIDFDVDGAPSIPSIAGVNTNVTPPDIAVDPNYNPFAHSTTAKDATQLQTPKSSGKNDWHRKHPVDNTTTNWEELYKAFKKRRDESLDGSTEERTINSDVFATSDTREWQCLQVAGRYIVASDSDALLVLDQHRAHLLVLHDKLLKQIDGTNIVSQSILFPEVLHLSPAQNASMQALLPELEKAGFNLSQLSGNDWSINAIPQGVESANVKELLEDVVDSLGNAGAKVKRQIYENIATVIARKAAIPYGRILSQSEMKQLIRDWTEIKNGRYTPGGKLVAARLDIEYLGKLLQ